MKKTKNKQQRRRRRRRCARMLIRKWHCIVRAVGFRPGPTGFHDAPSCASMSAFLIHPPAEKQVVPPGKIDKGLYQKIPLSGKRLHVFPQFSHAKERIPRFIPTIALRLMMSSNCTQAAQLIEACCSRVVSVVESCLSFITIYASNNKRFVAMYSLHGHQYRHQVLKIRSWPILVYGILVLKKERSQYRPFPCLPVCSPSTLQQSSRPTKKEPLAFNALTNTTRTHTRLPF